MNLNQLLAKARNRMAGLSGKPVSSDNLEKLSDIISEIEYEASKNKIYLESRWDSKLAKSVGIKNLYERMYNG